MENVSIIVPDDETEIPKVCSVGGIFVRKISKFVIGAVVLSIAINFALFVSHERPVFGDCGVLPEMHEPKVTFSYRSHGAPFHYHRSYVEMVRNGRWSLIWDELLRVENNRKYNYPPDVVF